MRNNVCNAVIDTERTEPPTRPDPTRPIKRVETSTTSSSYVPAGSADGVVEQ